MCNLVWAVPNCLTYKNHMLINPRTVPLFPLCLKGIDVVPPTPTTDIYCKKHVEKKHVIGNTCGVWVPDIFTYEHPPGAFSW